MSQENCFVDVVEATSIEEAIGMAFKNAASGEYFIGAWGARKVDILEKNLTSKKK